MSKNKQILSLVLIVALFAVIVLLVQPDSSYPNNNQLEKRILGGYSMEPLIKSGTNITLDYDYYRKKKIERNDLIAYQPTRLPRPAVKIAKAVPGDKFAIVLNGDDTGSLIINGEIARNSAGEMYRFNPNRAKMISLYADQYQGVIPPDLFLILGDRPSGTGDSTKYGLVPRQYIVAKVSIEF